jgi:hypothetical protein
MPTGSPARRDVTGGHDATALRVQVDRPLPHERTVAARLAVTTVRCPIVHGPVPRHLEPIRLLMTGSWTSHRIDQAGLLTVAP